MHDSAASTLKTTAKLKLQLISSHLAYLATEVLASKTHNHCVSLAAGAVGGRFLPKFEGLKYFEVL